MVSRTGGAGRISRVPAFSGSIQRVSARTQRRADRQGATGVPSGADFAKLAKINTTFFSGSDTKAYNALIASISRDLDDLNHWLDGEAMANTLGREGYSAFSGNSEDAQQEKDAVAMRICRDIDSARGNPKCSDSKSQYLAGVRAMVAPHSATIQAAIAEQQAADMAKQREAAENAQYEADAKSLKKRLNDGEDASDAFIDEAFTKVLGPEKRGAKNSLLGITRSNDTATGLNTALLIKIIGPALETMKNNIGRAIAAKVNQTNGAINADDLVSAVGSLMQTTYSSLLNNEMLIGYSGRYKATLASTRLDESDATVTDANRDSVEWARVVDNIALKGICPIFYMMSGSTGAEYGVQNPAAHSSGFKNAAKTFSKALQNVANETGTDVSGTQLSEAELGQMTGTSLADYEAQTAISTRLSEQTNSKGDIASLLAGGSSAIVSGFNAFKTAFIEKVKAKIAQNQSGNG